MSRAYEMAVNVEGFDVQNKDAILEVLKADSFEYAQNMFTPSEDSIQAFGEGSLCGGQTEDEYASEIAKEIFKANGKPCTVSVSATCLEDLPYETYSFDADKLP